MSVSPATAEKSENLQHVPVTGCEALGRAWKSMKAGISNNKGKIVFLFLVAAIAIPLGVTYHMPATRSAMHHFSHQVNQLYRNHPLVWFATAIVAVLFLCGFAKYLEISNKPGPRS